MSVCFSIYFLLSLTKKIYENLQKINKKKKYKHSKSAAIKFSFSYFLEEKETTRKTNNNKSKSKSKSKKYIIWKKESVSEREKTNAQEIVVGGKFTELPPYDCGISSNSI